jgi:hypothetical protein
LLPQQEALDLAAGGLRKHVDELDLPRIDVSGERRADVLLKFPA